jgi:hypothetical protein
MIDQIDDDERERRKRQSFIQHLREREEREARAPRFIPNENELREKRMRERETAERQEQSDEAADQWLVQRQCVDDLKRSESARVASAATRVAAEPELTEVFDYIWVQRHVAARLRDLEARFEARLAELSDAVAENAHAIANAFDAVDRALAKAGARANKELTGALERMSRQLSKTSMRSCGRSIIRSPTASRSKNRRTHRRKSIEMTQKFSEEQRAAILREAHARVQNVSAVEECFREYEERARKREAERAALAKIAVECETVLRENMQQ